MISLILIVTLLILLSYAISNKNILDPAFVCCAMFLVSLFAAYYNINTWGISLSDTTIALITLSLVMIIIGVNISRYMQRRMHSLSSGTAATHQLTYIKVERYKFICVILFAVFAGVVYFREVISVARNYGYSSGSGLSVMMNIYRRASNFTIADVDNRVSRLASYSFEILRAFAYIFTYIGINNLVIRKCVGRVKSTNKYFIITVLYMIVSLMTGGRMKILQLIIFMVALYIILLKKESNWNKRFKFRSLFKLIMIVFIVLSAFVGLRSVVGRTETNGAVEYLTKYIGGSIECLDLFVKNPVSPSNIWGKETFYNMYNFLSRRFNVSEWSYLFAKEFRRTPTGVSAGNVYTALRCFYYDFGFVGCLICCLLVGIVFGYLYYCIRYIKVKPGIDNRIMLFSYLFYSIVLFSINYYFDYLSVGFLKTIVIYCCAKYITVDLHIKFGEERIAKAHEY